MKIKYLVTKSNVLQKETDTFQVMYLNAALMAYFIQLVIYCAHGNELSYQVNPLKYLFADYQIFKS